MAGEPPMICSQCGYKLGSQEDEIAHPEDPDPPDDPHFKVQVRDDGEERLQCIETGRLAAPAGPGNDGIGSENLTYAQVYQKHHDENPPGMGEPQGEGQPQPDEPSRQESTPGGIYDVDEEKNQMDLLKDVITNPRYGLNDEHIQEVRGWSEDMDGRLPPQDLENILKNLKGIQKQTAQLIRQRYELKLNKWMREQSHNEEGPPIGVSTQPMPVQRGSNPSGRSSTPTPQQPRKNNNQDEDQDERDTPSRQSREGSGLGADNLREYRRTRRTRRRQETLDIAAETVAKEAADEVARELVGQFGGLLDIPRTVLQRKAEKDPDWFLEKAEALDIDIVDLMEPSEQRKKEMRNENNNKQSEVDSEIDDALDKLNSDDRQPDKTPDETPKSVPPEPQDESPMKASPDNDFSVEPDDSALEEMAEDDREGAELFE